MGQWQDALNWTRKLINRGGSIIILPEVSSMDRLLDGSSDTNPYGTSLTQLFPIGTKLVQGDRTWRYTKNGAVGLIAGAVLQSAATLHADADDDIVVGATAAAGTYAVTLTSSANLACAANTYREGYLFVNDEVGEGHAYKIKSHAALAGTANTIFYLYDPIVVALTTSSQVGLVKNPYADVVAFAASRTAIGIAPRAVTAAHFFWMQTGGPAAVIASAAITVAKRAVAASGKAGASVADENSLQTIGFPITPGVADTESFLCLLNLDK